MHAIEHGMSYSSTSINSYVFITSQREATALQSSVAAIHYMSLHYHTERFSYKKACNRFFVSDHFE